MRMQCEADAGVSDKSLEGFTEPRCPENRFRVACALSLIVRRSMRPGS